MKNLCNEVIVERIAAIGTDPETDLLHLTDGWYWCWHGEVWAFGPFSSREEAEVDARKAAE